MWEMGIPFFADLPWVTTRFVHILLYHFLRIEFHIPNLPNCRKFLIFAVQMHKGLIVTSNIKIKSGEYLESVDTQTPGKWIYNWALMGLLASCAIFCTMRCVASQTVSQKQIWQLCFDDGWLLGPFFKCKKCSLSLSTAVYIFKIKWQKTWQAFGKNVEAFVKTTFSFHVKRKTRYIIPRFHLFCSGQNLLQNSLILPIYDTFLLQKWVKILLKSAYSKTNEKI